MLRCTAANLMLCRLEFFGLHGRALWAYPEAYPEAEAVATSTAPYASALISLICCTLEPSSQIEQLQIKVGGECSRWTVFAQG